MASLLRWKDMYVKERLQGLTTGLNCSSAASTSVVASTGRAIDRHSPHLRDSHRRLPPSVPKPPRPISPFSSTKDSVSSSSLKQKQQQLCHYDDDGKDKRRKKKSTAAAAGSGTGTSSTSSSQHRKNKKKAVQVQQVSPASSSRSLLNSSRLMMQSDDEITVVDSLPPLPSPRSSFIADDNADEDMDIFPLSHGDAVLPVVPSRPQLVAPPVALLSLPSASGAGSSSSSSEIGGGHVVGGDNTAMVRSCSTRTGPPQVVVLRVSLHCKGCAGKVKKHISKMEGVTSFDIDIATKKVTVVGDVTPLGVLNSISKVKSAQFWPVSSFSTPPRASASF